GHNVFLGLGSGNFTMSGSGTDASNMTAVGDNTLTAIANETGSTAVGSSALRYSTGDYNTAFGSFALGNGEAGYQNVGVGAYALYGAAIGYSNVAVGSMALYSSYDGVQNVAIGESALYSADSGSYNIAIGHQAGNNLTTGSSNILIGYDIDAPSATGSSQLSIGNLIFATGGFGTGTTAGTGNVGIGTASPGVRLHVASSSDTNIFRLQDSDGTCSANPESGSVTWTCSSDRRLKTDIVDAPSVLSDLMKLDIRQYIVRASGDTLIGVIAQEAQSVMPNLVSQGDDGYLRVSELNSWQLIKAIQEEQGEIMEMKESFSKTLSEISLRTDANASTLGELQASVDEQLSVIGDSLKSIGIESGSLDERMTATDSRILTAENELVDLRTVSAEQDVRLATLESEVATLRDENSVIMDFFQTLDLNHVVMRDRNGNVDLLGGRLSAGILQAEKLCLEDVCVTKNQLRGMLDAAGQVVADGAGSDASEDGSVAGASIDSSAATFETWASNMDENWSGDYLMVMDEGVYGSTDVATAGYSVSYRVDLSGSEAKAKLTVKFPKNDSTTGIDRVTALRVFVPDGSWLFALGGNDGAPSFGSFRGRKYFAVPVRIPDGSGQEVRLEYVLPDAATAAPYDLKVERQTGVGEIPFTFTGIGADGAETDKQSTLDSAGFVLGDD
ncbi:MAG: hypothetical protein HGB18_05650, partial [Candidatus Moranbacteria bacterium]|nr:hypothetical protein [Candidatus Moranbacteria bacterium]